MTVGQILPSAKVNTCGRHYGGIAITILCKPVLNGSNGNRQLWQAATPKTCDKSPSKRLIVP